MVSVFDFFNWRNLQFLNFTCDDVNTLKWVANIEKNVHERSWTFLIDPRLFLFETVRSYSWLFRLSRGFISWTNYHCSAMALLPMKINHSLLREDTKSRHLQHFFKQKIENFNFKSKDSINSRAIIQTTGVFIK